MTFLELAGRRQSCRGYAPQPVGRDLIDRCLEAARLAPSACNSQPWSFYVIDQEPLRGALARETCTGLYRLNEFALQAPVLIAVVTERSKYTARMGGWYRGVQYSLIDIGIAGDHLTLQAAELGLGTCWLGWFNERAAKRVLGLPRAARIDVIFTLGYPADESVRPKNRKSLEEMRRYCPSTSEDPA
jgi:nitroreductase